MSLEGALKTIQTWTPKFEFFVRNNPDQARKFLAYKLVEEADQNSLATLILEGPPIKLRSVEEVTDDIMYLADSNTMPAYLQLYQELCDYDG